MRKLIKIPLFSAIIITVIFLVWILRPVQVGGGNYYFIVTSGSMKPVFGVGDLVICCKTTFEDVQVGDIIAVKYPYKEGVTIVHRVVEKGEDFLKTKGDVCDATDNFITVPENVLAKFTSFRIPKLGYLIVFSRTPLGLVLFYYLPCFAVIAIQVKKLIERDGVYENRDKCQVAKCSNCKKVTLYRKWKQDKQGWIDLQVKTVKCKNKKCGSTLCV